MKVSATALKTYRKVCKRKGAWAKIDGIRDPGSKATGLGSEVHKHMDAWCSDGLEPPKDDAGRLAGALIMKLDAAPGEGLVEEKFEFEFEDVTYHGFIDLQYEHQGVLRIRDHKTTSDLKWALTEETLADDEQGILYAGAAFDADPSIDEVELEWGYVTTKGKRRTKEVRLRVLRDENTIKLQELTNDAREMVEIYGSATTALEVEPNPNSCDAYGGCFYRDEHCKLTATERMKAIMAQGSLKERLEARKKAKEAEAPAETKAEAKTEKPKVNNKPKVSKDTPAINPPESKTQAAPSSSGGLTMRDQFALSALNGMLGNDIVGSAAFGVVGGTDLSQVAKKAYEVADEMLKAR